MIDRIIDVFPRRAAGQVRVQLASTLQYLGLNYDAGIKTTSRTSWRSALAARP